MTLLCHDYSNPKDPDASHNVQHIIKHIQNELPWIRCVIVKKRRSRISEERNGQIIFGDNPDTQIKEYGIYYSIDLMMNQDASFYLDTRCVRRWLKDHSKGASILNTFSYTGSLGLAALMGGSKSLVQLDLSAKFMNLAKSSARLNGQDILKSQYQVADFWSRINHYKKTQQSFDTVILDPPMYSKTKKGSLDLSKNYRSLINKLRPIINHNGVLISINNALFQTGRDHEDELLELCKDGYLSIEDRLMVDDDCIGAKDINGLPCDPMPYNHSTKMTVLRVKKKQSISDAS